MSKFRTWGLSVVTMVSVATAVLLVTGWSSAIGATITSVLVTNTATHPVPVRPTGTVPVHEQGTASVAVQNVDGSGNIEVHEQGTANVAITNATVPVHEQGTSKVTEQNVDANGDIKVHEQGLVPVSVGDPAAPTVPYTAIINCSASNSDRCQGHSDPIPNGKRLIIQTIGANGNATEGVTIPVFEIVAFSAAGTQFFNLLGQKTFDDQYGNTFSSADTRAVTLYADAGNFIDFVLIGSGTASNIQGGLCVTGYLVPMP